MEAAICIEMLYPLADPTEKVSEIASHGFRNIEFWDWRDKDIQKIAKLLREKHLCVVNFSGARKGDLIDRKTHRIFLEDLAESVSAARKLGTSTMMILTNELGGGGLVLHPYDDILDTEKRAAIIDGLRMAMGMVPAGMKLVLEPLNTILDHRGYFLSDMEQACSIVHELGDPRLKILCDLYHQGMMGDDLELLIDTYLDDIGHFHIADFPGRHEPGTGKGRWLQLLKRIGDRGWDGIVGFEYSPKDDSGESLESIRKLWEQVG